MINNAGAFIPGEICTEDDGILEKLMSTNLFSAYHLTRTLVHSMMKNDIGMGSRGHIMNISSVAALKAYPNGGSYSISKYALEGFNLDVVDYLVKPVSIERFVKACNKAWELYNLKTKPGEVITDKPAEYIFVNVEYSLLKVVIDDIMWIEGLKDYIKIQLKSSSKPVITRMTMKSVEELLPAARFIRIHKSYIAAINFITTVRKSAVMIGSTELPVSDTYQEALMKITGK